MSKPKRAGKNVWEGASGTGVGGERSELDVCGNTKIQFGYEVILLLLLMSLPLLFAKRC